MNDFFWHYKLNEVELSSWDIAKWVVFYFLFWTTGLIFMESKSSDWTVAYWVLEAKEGLR